MIFCIRNPTSSIALAISQLFPHEKINKIQRSIVQSRFLLGHPVYDANVAGAANSSAVAQSEGETVRNVSRPSSSTITWSGGTTATVPSLSAAARSFYAARGVSVT